MARRWGTSFFVIALLVTSCGGSDVDGAPTTTGASTDSTVAADPTVSASTATTIEAQTQSQTATPPGVAALTSGRGDDGSLEVGVWFASDPFAAGDVRLIIGTDSDESYPGTGDPFPHLDGWVEIGDEIALFDAGTAVASGSDLDELFAWTGPGRQAWFYFIGNVPVRAGTVWVMVEVDGSIVTGGVAGAPLNTACSFQSAGVDLGATPGDLPDNGAPCRYPLG